MKSLVLGFGVSGKAASRLLEARGEDYVVYDDSNPIDIPYSEINRAIVSPGVPPSHPTYQELQRRGCPIVGEVELALSLASPGFRFLGVTGTNGKTTVTLLIAHLLQSAGVEALAVGNVGVPVSEAILGEEKTLVIELSSFQLETLKSRKLELSVVLNITPDHLDRYPSFEEYAAAKVHIQQVTRGDCFFHRDVFEEFTPPFPSKAFGPNTDLCMTDEGILDRGELFPIERYGFHPEHLLAAYALTKPKLTPEQFIHGLKTFQRPLHRLSFVRKLHGVVYIDDSKATNLASMLYALECLEGPIFLIAGGRDKGSDYQACLSYFKNKVEKVYLLGEAAEKMVQAWEGHVPLEKVDKLENAVLSAFEVAKEGATVLLSPACSSFDQFKNYQERGSAFRFFVEELK